MAKYYSHYPKQLQYLRKLPYVTDMSYEEALDFNIEVERERGHSKIFAHQIAFQVIDSDRWFGPFASKEEALREACKNLYPNYQRWVEQTNYEPAKQEGEKLLAEIKCQAESHY